MPKDYAALKRALRAEIRSTRQATPQDERRRLGATLTGHLIELSFTLGIDSVAAYLSTATEPATRPFLEWAHSHGIRVLLPVSREDGQLGWTEFAGDAAESTDHLGLPTSGGQFVDPGEVREVGLILVPAASVDKTGMRMGWGRGYYDRLLAAIADGASADSATADDTSSESMESRPPVYAVIFDNESVDSLPSEPHDQHVDGVVTPSGITNFAE
jgi:5-formyltetrahydrofolate cyclo-ligase